VFHSGAMVQRLARGPFKAEIRVRFPLALPSLWFSWIGLMHSAILG
jgi:hypothetical protein